MRLGMSQASRALAAALVLALVASAAGEQAAGHSGGAHSGGSRFPRRSGAGETPVTRHADAAAAASATGGSHGRGRPVPIVLPSATDPTKLTLQKEGLDALRAVKAPVAPVVVIGPYRSGKSFLLNQLLGVPCDAGFGVGHTRKTETKGVWMWSEPTFVASETPGEPPNAIVYVDTEGFEATGMSDAYDDRIFALSSIVASVLVYNLPETVKESDIEKLSFALELAREFSSRGDQGDGSTKRKEVGDDDDSGTTAADEDRFEFQDASQLETFLPRSLLWLIQRDFLEGSTVHEMVDAALRNVANPVGDDRVNELNRVRSSLRALAKKHAAFGLTQPHLERTRLCELRDDQLETNYVEQREVLRSLVRKEAVAKSFLGAALTSGKKRKAGTDFVRDADADGDAADSNDETASSNLERVTGASLAALVERSVTALNEGDFPTAGSVVDSFNRDAMERAVEGYAAAAAATSLPAEIETLLAAHADSKRKQLKRFRSERFGRGAVTTETLSRKLDLLFDQRKEKNAFLSAKECDVVASACEDALVKMQNMRLPSLRKFDAAATRRCTNAFAANCVGPSKQSANARVMRAIERERNAFSQTYHARLLNGLLLIAVGGVVTFRFVWVAPLAEVCSWALFVFLEVAPKLYFPGAGGDGMFESKWWTTAGLVWETAVYNPLFDMDTVGPIVLVGVVVFGVWVRVRRCARFVHGVCPVLVPSVCHPMLGVKNEDRPRSKMGKKTDRGRDLDV